MDIFVKYLIEQKRLRILMDEQATYPPLLRGKISWKCKSNNKEKCQKMTKQFVIHGS